MTEYTIHQLSKLSGVTSRTLRHYDEIGLLKPAKKNSAGYRVYGPKEVDTLQQILLHKESGLSLKTIQQILSDPSFNVVNALRDQKQLLLKQKKHIDGIIKTIDETIKSYVGEITMNDTQKFAHLKKQMIQENDQKYGEEVKQRWGEEAWKKSNQQFASMTQDQFNKSQAIDAEFKQVLNQAFESGDPTNELSKTAVELHKQWLTIFWPSYSLEAHLGLAQMYVDDSRFHHYFNDRKELAEFFRDAIQACMELNAET